MKRLIFFLVLIIGTLFKMSAADPSGNSGSETSSAIDYVCSQMGMNLLDNEIDDVIFKSNEFITNSTFTKHSGPFWWILMLSMALAMLFASITCAGMAYKMMYKGEPLDVMKLLKPLGVSLVLYWWYPPQTTGMFISNSEDCVLDMLAYVPNCIGSFTQVLYLAEAEQVQMQFNEATMLIKKRDEYALKEKSKTGTSKSVTDDQTNMDALAGAVDTENQYQVKEDSERLDLIALLGGTTVFIDKLLMTFALVMFRIGWWATIYCQQIILGMLTIFGPIQWAFSLLPKWEGAWAKWLIRYLTVHFYGAMLYFVGFYVLLLFDIVLNIQIENLKAVTANESTYREYANNAFLTAGYLVAASIVSLKCLNLVPDLAAWMIPEGEASFSTRNFGEGVAAQASASAKGVIGKVFG